MTNTEQLFIRACKSLNPAVRVRSVYRRFYGNYEDCNYGIAHLLSLICEDKNLITVFELVDSLNPDTKYRYAENTDDYWTFVMNVMISKIRLCEISKLKGYKNPLRFRVA